MIVVLTRSERWLRVMAMRLHDLAGWPFQWLIFSSPIKRWIQQTDPNSWSLMRLPLSFVIALLLRGDHDGWAIGVFVFALLTDRLDGELARALGKTSQLGKQIDTFVDAAMMAAILLGLADRLPSVPLGEWSMNLGQLFVLLETLRLLGGFFLGSWSSAPLERAALEPNLSGKYKTAAAGVAVILLLLNYRSWAIGLLLTALGLAVYSLLRHLIDWGVARAHRPLS